MKNYISFLLKIGYIICFLVTPVFPILAQQPFDCNGRTYRVIEKNRGTYLQEIIRNPDHNSFEFSDLHFFSGKQINAIAYHPSQDVIYGVLQKAPYRLCRIDGNFNLQVLAELDIPAELSFVSGDLSPDEQYLVLFGFEQEQQVIVLVDLWSGKFKSKILPIYVTDPMAPAVYCADISFHPTTGQLFGFDFKSKKLITLDIEKQLIDNTTYPPNTIVKGNIPSIFFNAQGELFGIGAPSQEQAQHRNVYEFDIITGEATLLQQLGEEGNQDACSCPYQVKVLNRVSQRITAACTELTFDISLINKTEIAQEGLTLTGLFPEGSHIKEITALPIEGAIKKGIGSQELLIENIHLPIGTFPFTITVAIEEEAITKNYSSQLYLEGVLLAEKVERVASDDPETIIPNDATRFAIQGYENLDTHTNYQMCEGTPVSIGSNIEGAVQFHWNTEATTAQIQVTEIGDYSVTITTDCGKLVQSFSVYYDDIEVELGNDQLIHNGQLVALSPVINTQSPVRSFQWETNSASLNCSTCANPIAMPRSDTEIAVMVENQSGCQALDHLFIKVIDTNIFTPTAFSPNGDNQNDYFYLHSNLDMPIKRFQIFDRWGNLLFLQTNITSNQATFGWDGRAKGQPAAESVYVWVAEIQQADGQKEVLTGDVQLLR